MTAAPALSAAVLAAALVGPMASAAEAAPEEIQLQRVPRAVGLADLVAVVKITEVGEARAVNEGLEGDEARFQQNFALPNMWDKIKKRAVAAELTEVLRAGPSLPEKEVKTLKAIRFRIFTSTQTGKERIVFASLAELAAGNPFKAHYRNPSCPLELAKGKEVLLFLKAGERNVVEGEKESVERTWTPVGTLFSGETGKAVAAVKEAIAKLAEWETPPKLSGEAAAAVKKLIAELGSENFETRDAATKALVAKGASVKPLVEELIKTGTDPEARMRGQQVLEALKPETLKEDAGWPGVVGINPGIQ